MINKSLLDNLDALNDTKLLRRSARILIYQNGRIADSAWKRQSSGRLINITGQLKYK